MDAEVITQLMTTLNVMTKTHQDLAELGVVLTRRVLELEGRVKQLEDEVRVGSLHTDEQLDRLQRQLDFEQSGQHIADRITGHD